MIWGIDDFIGPWFVTQLVDKIKGMKEHLKATQD